MCQLSPIDKILCRLYPSLFFPEFETPCRADHGAALVDNSGHGRPLGLDDVAAPINHALVALLYEVDLAAEILSEPVKGFNGVISDKFICCESLFGTIIAQ